MRKGFLTFGIVSLIVLGSCKNKKSDESYLSPDLVNNPNTALTEGIDTADLPKFEFIETEHDFGKILQGEVVSYSFRFVNKGKTDLIISNANASCGCTVPEYPKKPIKPNEEASVTVTFNAANRIGMQKKYITITANTQPNFVRLLIKAQVLENLDYEMKKIGG